MSDGYHEKTIYIVVRGCWCLVGRHLRQLLAMRRQIVQAANFHFAFHENDPKFSESKEMLEKQC